MTPPGFPSCTLGQGPWLPFGTHAVMPGVPRLEFGNERDEGLLPMRERHMYHDAHACEVCRQATEDEHDGGAA